MCQSRIKEKNGYRETLPNVDDSGWPGILNNKDEYDIKANDSLKSCVIRGEFDLPEYSGKTEITLWPKSLCQEEFIYVNGHLIAQHIKRGDPDKSFRLSHSILRKGKNVYAVVGTPLKQRYKYDNLNTNPGIVQVKTPAGTWTRSAFNGLAQIVVQSTRGPGNIVLTATSKGLSGGKITIHTRKVPLQPSVPAMKE